MNYPGQGWPGQPQPDDQGQAPAGGWPQQQYPQQQYPQQQQQFPQTPYQGLGQQPYGGQPPYQGQQFPGQQPYGMPGQQPPSGQFPPMQYPIAQPGYGPPAPKKRRNGLIIGVVAAVVVAAGAGVGTWFALNHASTVGAASPQDAATKLLADVGNDDVLGMVNDLPPAEASLLRDTIQGTTDQLKRLQVIKPDATPQGATGVTVHTSGITFDNAGAERINDHLTITKLVSGTITISQGMSGNNFTDSFLHSAFPNGVPSGKTQTVNIADAVKQLGHPIRIATVNVNGSWYPSLFYSIADAGLQESHKQWPAQSIPAVGASSPDAAVQQFVQAIANSDARGVIERTAPDEMAALHDVGQVLVDSAGSGGSGSFKIDSMHFADRSVSGGTDAVLTGMTITEGDNQITVTASGGCYAMQASTGESQRFCASDVTKQLDSGDHFLPAALTKLLTDMVTGMMNKGVGVVATQVNGQWYVSPGRTISQLVLDMYGTITPDDLANLLKLAH